MSCTGWVWRRSHHPARRGLFDLQRDALLDSRLLEVHGVWQRQQTVHLIAGRLVDITPMLARLATESRDLY